MDSTCARDEETLLWEQLGAALGAVHRAAPCALAKHVQKACSPPEKARALPDDQHPFWAFACRTSL